MVRGEFEKELEQYIAQRRKSKPFKLPKLFNLKKAKKMEPELPPEIQKYEEGTPAEPVEIPGEEAAQKKSLFSRVLEAIGLTKGEKAREEQIPPEEVQKMLAQEEHAQDMKEIAKIALSAIKQLPPEQLAQFKSSPEFARLKDLLRKYQLIK